LVVQGQRDRQVAGLLASLEADFSRDDWSTQGLAAMDATLEQLAIRAPDQAAAGRARLIQNFAGTIQAKLSQPTLPPDLVALIEMQLDLLAERDAQEAAKLRAALQRRLHAWKEMGSLCSPFSRLEDVFDPTQVTISGKSLSRADDLVPARDPVVCTRMNSAGAVRLEAIFDSSWVNGDQIGLLLDATKNEYKHTDKEASSAKSISQGGDAYRFLLRASLNSRAKESKDARPISFLEVRQHGGQAVVEIQHGRTVLRREYIEAEDLPSGPLSLTATKAGDQLRITVGGLPAINFRDPFPHRGMSPGVFAVWWPAGARISQLRLLRRTLPESPSSLERGDALYSSQQFAEAATAYQQQAQAFGSEEGGQEARYKEAMCWLALNQLEEAAEILESLAGEQGDRWPALATCQLWLQRVRRGEFDQTDAIFESVAARYRLEQLAELVPYALHDEIVSGYSAQSTGLNLYKPNPAMVRECEQALAIAELFGSDPNILSWARQQLVRAYRATGQEERALAFTAQVVSNARKGRLAHGEHALVPEYTWLLRLAGRPEEALAEIDRWIHPSDEQRPASDQDEWVLERVRILVALERWEEAENVLVDLLTSVGRKGLREQYMAACAMLGFLKERRGDDLAAQQAWKDGAEADWFSVGSGFTSLDGVIVASLAGEVTEDEAEAFARKVASRAPGGSPVGLAEGPLGGTFLPSGTIASVLRETFRGPRGRECARKIVFREVTFAECVRLPMLLIAAEAIRQTGMGGQVTDEQDEIIWEVVEGAYSALFETGSISKPQLLQLGFTWKGFTNFVGWAGVASRLDPQLRGPVAYVVGHRYLRMNRQDDALRFFRTARDDAPDGSPLKILAQAELDRLAGSTPDKH
jgi:tetratricopeptide (TPR) repeat protein